MRRKSHESQRQVAGVHGNRTHPDPTWSGHSRFEDDGSHQAPSTPRRSPQNDAHGAPGSTRPHRSRRCRERRKDTPSSATGGHGHEQPARRLRIERERTIGARRRALQSTQLGRGTLRCAPRRRCECRDDHSSRAPRQARAASRRRCQSVTSLAARDVRRVAEQTEAGDVGGAPHAERTAARLAGAVERAHRLVQRLEAASSAACRASPPSRGGRCRAAS